MDENFKDTLSKIKTELDAALDIINNSGIAGRIIDAIAEHIEIARKFAGELQKSDAPLAEKVADYARLETADGYAILCPADKVETIKAQFVGVRLKEVKW
ncbi:MAG: hypothetical protein N3A66_04410 [Planctomycetota bacterium]|nr:hypothetical protein [Planctomycetota bacterium]